MKRCPSCQRTYPDDSPDYCSNDGMRLVNEEAAGFDPEKTIMSSGRRDSELVEQSTLSGADTQPEQQAVQQSSQQASQSSAPPAPQPAPMPGDQQAPPQSWQQQPPNQYAPVNQQSPPPQEWSPSPAPPAAQSSQPAPAWGGSPYQQSQANAPYGASYVVERIGRSRALAIAALVFGTNAINMMFVRLLTRMPYGPYRQIKVPMGVLSVGGLGLGIAALILALRNPSKFGGVELAIVGLATGIAALVYMLLN